MRPAARFGVLSAAAHVLAVGQIPVLAQDADYAAVRFAAAEPGERVVRVCFGRRPPAAPGAVKIAFIIELRHYAF